jgi:F-type H+-transporting ATPase subunit a
MPAMTGMKVIDLFVGLLELVSEFAKIVSFTFRLFGNIFAGAVLLFVMSFLVPFFVPLPFYGLELFVGFMQAFVFAILTLIFMVMATVSHAPGHDHH